MSKKLPQLISNELIESWQNQSSDDPIGLYTEITDRLNTLFASDTNHPMYTSMLRNLNVIYGWQTDGDSRFEQPARDSMVHMRYLLALVELGAAQYRMKGPQFFNPKANGLPSIEELQDRETLSP